MSNYTYHKKLKTIWENACANYSKGEREASKMVSPDEIEWIESIGLNQYDLFDAVDDFNRYEGDPDFETFLLVSSVRRDYFIEVQKGEPTGNQITTESLPAKTDAVKGVVWLPRIYDKAVAKIKGELNPDIMFGCAGDRKFLKEYDIHPADMLRAAWQFEHDPEAFFDWVIAHK
jgi:hypothetical protein